MSCCVIVDHTVRCIQRTINRLDIGRVIYKNQGYTALYMQGRIPVHVSYSTSIMASCQSINQSILRFSSMQPLKILKKIF